MFIISVTVHDTNDMLHTAELNKRSANKAVMLTKEARGAFRKHTQYYKTFGTSCMDVATADLAIYDYEFAQLCET